MKGRREERERGEIGKRRREENEGGEGEKEKETKRGWDREDGKETKVHVWKSSWGYINYLFDFKDN